MTYFFSMYDVFLSFRSFMTDLCMRNISRDTNNHNWGFSYMFVDIIDGVFILNGFEMSCVFEECN